MLIRAATEHDWPAILALFALVVRGGESFALPRDADEAAMRGYWWGPGHAVFVAEIDGALVGSYFLRPNQSGPGSHVGNAGYLVDPRLTGRGIATTLCAHSLETARAHGFRAMQFNFVVSTNERAVRLWHHMGFAIVGTLPQAFAHPQLGFVDVFVMFRSLVD